MVSVSEHPCAESLLEGLDPEQRAVATSLTGPVCVLAGAGTGKTRAITHRIAYGVAAGVYNPTSVLAVTFTARAAGELRERLRGLGARGVQASTFHSAALRQLSYFLRAEFNRPTPRIVELKAPLVAQAAARLGFEVDRAAVRDLSAEIEWAKVNLWTAEDYQKRAGPAGRGDPAGLDHVSVARLIRVYEQVLGESEAMDFEDVLLAMAGLMDESPAVARRVRSQYRHFVVDEYQDVSPLQQRLLDLWLGDRQELCVVGDPAQTIYSFAGASSRYLTEFKRRYPRAAVVELVRDYRSTPQVVSLANSVLRRGGVKGVELVSQRPSGPAVTFRSFADDAAEAAGVAAQISELVASGVEPDQIAVLYRTNSQSEPLENALASAGVGYQVRGGERFFARREVRQALAALRSAARVEALEPVVAQVENVLGRLGWSAAPPTERGAVRARWESLDALATLAGQLVEAGAEDLRQVVELIGARAEVGHAPAAAGVTLASLHSAKGLEWEAVFLVGLAEGLVPISLADHPDDIAEERRLLYVGVTRAKRHLQLSYAKARTAGGNANRRFSRFLNGLWPTAEQAAKKARGLDVPGADELTAAESALFERLREWRLGIARAEGRAAFAVLTDLTLRALAARRPRDRKGLAAIPGVGPVKIEQYGRELLAVIAAESAHPRPAAAATPPAAATGCD
ncbi:MAG: ATP-dependent DNA helicase UvrD2 [Bifidobacteriaceae bacterium]|jgi:DNA helicase-2/ATP-dependent DNA helicase PcrA|nr:ATP-dependent DNA helicase UvrD2 [Bifidobacteriaceae bacterium]